MRSQLAQETGILMSWQGNYAASLVYILAHRLTQSAEILPRIKIDLGRVDALESDRPTTFGPADICNLYVRSSFVDAEARSAFNSTRLP